MSANTSNSRCETSTSTRHRTCDMEGTCPASSPQSNTSTTRPENPLEDCATPGSVLHDLPSPSGRQQSPPSPRLPGYASRNSHLNSGSSSSAGRREPAFGRRPSAISLGLSALRSRSDSRRRSDAKSAHSYGLSRAESRRDELNDLAGEPPHLSRVRIEAIDIA